MKTLLIVTLMLAVSGCISTEHSSDSKRDIAAANPDGLICKKEKPTGSHRAIKTCRTVGEVQRQKEEAEEGARRIRNQSSVNSG